MRKVVSTSSTHSPDPVRLSEGPDVLHSRADAIRADNLSVESTTFRVSYADSGERKGFRFGLATDGNFFRSAEDGSLHPASPSWMADLACDEARAHHYCLLVCMREPIHGRLRAVRVGADEFETAKPCEVDVRLG
jgi:hypothetical protein